MQALLALEDGRIFAGESFSARGTTTGEVCFNTSMTGYQEVLTDPSYAGQIVAMTYPLIGNYGVSAEDDESCRSYVRGFVVEELCREPSNWRSSGTLEEFLAKWNIIGIQRVDTRALTRHLRTRGTMKACLTTELTAEEAVKTAVASQGVVGMDFSAEVSTPAPYDWDPEDVLSQPWKLPHGAKGPADAKISAEELLVAPKYRIVAIDYGIKRNILRRLRQAGFLVKVVPATANLNDILKSNPDGVFLSNGPGDPAALSYAHNTLKELVGRRPIFGICLGHQLLGYAFGGRTFKLKFGHRGGNQPVKDLRTNRVSITSQNHGFAVDPTTLPKQIEITHVNLNDGTVEGMRHKKEPVFSVQYHPEAAPGPNDAAYFFAEFSKLIEES